MTPQLLTQGPSAALVFPVRAGPGLGAGLALASPQDAASTLARRVARCQGGRHIGGV